jgi:hypothetical protein
MRRLKSRKVNKRVGHKMMILIYYMASKISILKK